MANISLKEWLIFFAIINFFLPFFIVLKNPSLSRREKIKRLLRASLIMGIFSGSVILYAIFFK